MDVFTKQPSEIYTVDVSFANVLATGETIASYTVTATLADVVTSGVIDSYTLTNSIVYVKVKAGITGNNYKITVVATTSLGNVYEYDVLMKVCEL